MSCPTHADSQKLVSIIIPAYNTEQFIEKCLNSVKSQTYTNFECIVVDDGSKDKTNEICRRFSDSDPRFITVRKKNEGCAIARNAGLDMAVGDYIAFLDSDDYLDEDFLLKMMQANEKYDADIVVCGYRVKNNRHENDVHPTNLEKVIFGGEAILKEYLSSSGVAGILCNKLYKKHLFNNIRLPNITSSEDNATTYLLMDLSKTTVLIPDALYYYIRRGNSTDSIHYRTINKHFISVDVAEDRYHFISEKYPALENLVNRNRWKMYEATILRLFMCGAWIKYKAELSRYLDFINNNEAPSQYFADFKKKISTVPYINGMAVHIKYQVRKDIKQCYLKIRK